MIDEFIWAIFFILNPLLFKGEIINVYELPKIIFLSITVTIVLAIYIIKKPQRVNKYFLLGFLAFVVLSLVNLSISINPRRSLLGNKMVADSLIALILYFIFTFSLLTSRIKKERLVDFGVLMGTSLAIVTVLHFVALALGITHISYDERVTATIGQPNILGGILVGLIPLAYYKIKRNYKKEKKTKRFRLYLTISVIQMALITTAMLLTFSRGAYLAFLTIISIEIFYILKRRNLRIIYVSLISLFFAIIVFSPPIDTGKIDAPYLVERFLSFKDQEKLNDPRFEIWRNSLRIVAKRPILGFGNATFQQDYERYIDIDHAPTTKFQEVESSHNLVLDILIEWGILGFAFVVGALTLLLLKTENRYFKYVLIAILVRSMFNVTSVTIYIVLFLSVALLLKPKDGKNEKTFDLSKSQNKISKNSVQNHSVLNAMCKLRHRALVIFMFLLSLGIMLIYLSIYKSEKFEYKAMHEGDTNKVIKNYKSAILYNPLKQDLYTKLISVLMWKSDYKTAEKYAYVSAYKFNDAKSYYYLGKIYKPKNTDKAILLYEKASSLSAKNPNIKHDLGILYYEIKDYDNAYKNFLDVVKINKKDFSDDFIYLAEIDYKRGNIENAIKYTKLSAPSWRRDRMVEKLNIDIND